MSEEQLEKLKTINKLVESCLPNCKTFVQKHIFEEIQTLIEEIEELND